ncbi:unnamed protein product, partial [Polarella glacialis]
MCSLRCAFFARRLPQVSVLGRRLGRVGAVQEFSSLPEQGAFEPHARASLWAEKRLNREGMWDRDMHDQTFVRLAAREDDADGPFDAEQRQLSVQVARLGRERRWEEALAVLASVPEAGTKLRTAALSACARSLQLERGQRIFEEIQTKTVPSCNAYIMLLGRLKRIRDIEKLLAFMRTQELQPTGVTYGCLMTAYGMVQDTASVMRAFNDMRSAGIMPTTVTFGSALGALARSGETAQALELLKEMDKMRLETGPGHYTSTIVSCARSKNEPKAREIFQEMKQRGLRPNVVAYTGLMACIPPAEGATQK